ESLDNTMADSADVEHRLQLPVLGILPVMKDWMKKDRHPMNDFVNDLQTGFAENVRTIRTGILLSSMDDQKKVVLVTSSVPGEGKSLMSINLALSLAQMGKTLLLDADMRRPTIAPVFGYDKQGNGLSQFIAGSCELKEAIHKYNDQNLYVMTAGIIPPNPLEMLSSARFVKAL